MSCPVFTYHLNRMIARGASQSELARSIAKASIALENLAMLADSESPAVDHLQDWLVDLTNKTEDMRASILAIKYPIAHRPN
jgi:hypothetical protein